MRQDVNVKRTKTIMSLVAKSLREFIDTYSVRQCPVIQWSILPLLPNILGSDGKRYDVVPVLIFLEDNDVVKPDGKYCVALETHHSAGLLLPRVQKAAPAHELEKSLVA